MVLNNQMVTYALNAIVASINWQVLQESNLFGYVLETRPIPYLEDL